MMRVRQHGPVAADKLIEQIEWLLANFDFEKWRITVNDDEDIEVDSTALRKSIGTMHRVIQRDGIGARAANILRTYYFADEELGMLFRLKFL